MKKINRIKRSDYNRILITETLPYETPIIFSNDGLYDRVASLEATNEVQKTIIKALVFGEGLIKPVNSTIPYLYKVRKNSTELRRLALLHPMSQWKIKCFYQKYESLILHYCSVSPASIRAPNSITSSFYNKSSWENVNQYKTGNVSVIATDKYAKHTPSFFSYRGYDRLYKFFNSRDYMALEKKFEIFLSLDVSKCFDSIYTHCLSWSVKDKQFTKQNLSVSSTFAQEFDTVIRHGNHNETNGIPIGPEISRIFAEILFQEIDRQAVARIKNYKFGADYTFRRYVDDVFVFAKSDAIAKLVYETYTDVLVSFNLHVNSAKSSKLSRPFFTVKSRLIFDTTQKSDEFFQLFLIEVSRFSLKPKRIFSVWKLTKLYIDSVKALCSHCDMHYDEVASYLIAIFTERVKQLVHNDLTDADASSRADYLSAMQIMVEILFFLYSVAPSVSASYKLCTSIILAIRFCHKNIPEHTNTLSQHIYDLTSTLLVDQSSKTDGEGIDGFIRLEFLNVVLAVRELGERYLLPEKIIDDLFIKGRALSYFTIVSCLFYVKSDIQYANLRKRLLDEAFEKLSDLSDVFMNCEKAYLLLDMLSCPFVQDDKKKNWANALHSMLGKSAPTNAQTTAFLANISAEYWQVNWDDVDLLNSLEKKELKQAY